MGVRRAMDSSSYFLVIDGQFVGVYMAADFTAEHEWGIKKLQDMFQISGEGQGIDKVKVGRGIPEQCLYFQKKGKVTYLICREAHWNDSDELYTSEREELAILNDKHYVQPNPFTFAWCESSFGIATTDATHAEYLTELKEAILSGDVLIYLGQDEKDQKNPFSRAGLCIVIASRTPQFIKESFEKEKDKV